MKYADYTKATILALSTVGKYSTPSIPIDLLTIIKQFPELRICPYSKLAYNRNCSISELIEYFDSELGTYAFDLKNNRYVIYYNDTKSNTGLDRFTIGHELGHHVLGHSRYMAENEGIIKRGGLTERQYTVLENEADCFSRNLLAPLPLMDLLDISFDEQQISSAFNISFSAAVTRIRLYYTDKKAINNKIMGFFGKKFENSINTYRYGKRCSICKYFFIHKTARYCPICGSCNLIIREVENNMIHDGIAVDRNSKCLLCPKCNNEELEGGDYCKVCGIYVVNKCTNIQYGYDNIIEYECGKIAEGNARYCVECGNKTTFFENGILEAWDVDQPKEFEQKSTTLSSKTDEFIMPWENID